MSWIPGSWRTRARRTGSRNSLLGPVVEERVDNCIIGSFDVDGGEFYVVYTYRRGAAMFIRTMASLRMRSAVAFSE